MNYFFFWMTPTLTFVKVWKTPEVVGTWKSLPKKNQLANVSINNKMYFKEYIISVDQLI